MADHVAHGGDIIPARLRGYLYPIALAALLLLAGYGVIEESKVALWAGLVTAIFGLSTATAYRPKP